ncbi:MAG TPA: hypothetical protein VFK85_07085 [Anaeromyxobacteraceae bacterium]|nr:hypothetical protein [Anaeromyxobacteraceae bacterium]
MQIRELVKFIRDLRTPPLPEHVAMRSVGFDYDDLGQFVDEDDVPVDKVEHVHLKSTVFDWPLDDLGQYVDEADTPLDRINPA